MFTDTSVDFSFFRVQDSLRLMMFWTYIETLEIFAQSGHAGNCRYHVSTGVHDHSSQSDLRDGYQIQGN